MTAPEIQLERAITHMLVTDECLLATYAPLLDKRMYLEKVNHAFIESAYELATEGNLSKLNLLERVESKGFENASKSYTEQAAAITSSSDIQKHYKSWIEYAKLRFIEVCDAELKAKNPTSAELIRARAENLEKALVLGIPDEGISMAEALDSAATGLQKMKDMDGDFLVTTGYEEIDRNILGLLPGTLTTIAARPGAGKTTIACELSIRAASLGRGPVIFNTLEMTAERVGIKIAAKMNQESSLDYERSFQKAQPELDKVKGSLKSQRELKIRFFDTTSIGALESSIIQLKPSLVIWDFLQIVATPANFVGRRQEFIGEMARGLQQIAKRREVPVVVLCQLNREGKGEGADLSNIKDSATVEEASDNILFLTRPNFGEKGIDGIKCLLSLKKARSGIVDGKIIELLINPLNGAFERWNPIYAAQLCSAAGI